MAGIEPSLMYQIVSLGGDEEAIVLDGSLYSRAEVFVFQLWFW